jgi:hypothetical protein
MTRGQIEAATAVQARSNTDLRISGHECCSYLGPRFEAALPGCTTFVSVPPRGGFLLSTSAGFILDKRISYLDVACLAPIPSETITVRWALATAGCKVFSEDYWKNSVRRLSKSSISPSFTNPIFSLFRVFTSFEETASVVPERPVCISTCNIRSLPCGGR